MKKRIAAVFAVAILILSPTATAASKPVLIINGKTAETDVMANIYNNTTYVSLRSVSSILDPASIISWETGTAKIRTKNLTFTARAGDTYVKINGSKINVPDGVKNLDGRILVPLRTLADAYNAVTYWSPVTKSVTVFTEINETYSSDDLYWLSRIISSESRGEPLEGKIAVGNVVLNRVNSSDFPNTIYGVIFDKRWGGQFEPVRNGTIYQKPTEESILAAKLCLNGANVIGDSLYFLAPALAQNFWTVENREYITTIGCHDFYR